MFFSVLAGIIPLSLRNGGHLLPFAHPLVCKWGGGNCPLCPRLHRLWVDVKLLGNPSVFEQTPFT